MPGTMEANSSHSIMKNQIEKEIQTPKIKTKIKKKTENEKKKDFRYRATAVGFCTGTEDLDFFITKLGQCNAWSLNFQRVYFLFLFFQYPNT